LALGHLQHRGSASSVIEKRKPRGFTGLSFPVAR
jgi:hypothetical protein